MAPRYQTNCRVQKDALKRRVAKDVALMTKDGSARTVIYAILAKRYNISASSVRAYAKELQAI